MTLNVILAIVEFIFIFGMIPVARKFFGKSGLIGLMVMCILLANVQTLKVIELGTSWLSVGLGNVAFAAIFTISDLINHKYSAKEARQGVTIATFSYVIFFIAMQLTLAFVPGQLDWIQDSLKTVYGTDGLYIWVSIGGILAFYIGQLINTVIFEWLVKRIKSQSKIALWFKSATSSLANLLENFIFGFLGYVALPSIFASKVIMPFSYVVSTSMIGTVLEGIITVFSPIALLLGASKFFTPKDEQ